MIAVPEPVDESWPMVEEAVLQLFDDIASEQQHVALGPRLNKLGWPHIESEFPLAANMLLFSAAGLSLASTDCLDRAVLAELSALVDDTVEAIVLPEPTDAYTPTSSDERVAGIVVGPLRGRIAVPIAGAMGSVSISVVDADRLTGEPVDTFDPTVRWTRVTGALSGNPVEASTEWNRGVEAAHRALGTELVALSDAALQITIEQVSARAQFGSPIGSLQSPRHALADAASAVAGARALLEESWRYGGRLSALAGKSAAGRAHRAVAEVALQVCGAVGLTAEHKLHRYVARGFQLDALFGSADRLEILLSDYLFDVHAADKALPAVFAWT